MIWACNNGDVSTPYVTRSTKTAYSRVTGQRASSRSGIGAASNVHKLILPCRYTWEGAIEQLTAYSQHGVMDSTISRTTLKTSSVDVERGSLFGNYCFTNYEYSFIGNPLKSSYISVWLLLVLLVVSSQALTSLC
jgi:hypothetical protein